MRPPLRSFALPTLALVAALTAVAASSAAAQQGLSVSDPRIGPGAALDLLREELQYARYEEAASDARDYLERADLSATERNAGLEVLAAALLANRDHAAAATVLAELFSRDPEHRVGDADASPVVQAAFQRAHEEHPTPVQVALRVERPRFRPGAATIDVHVRSGHTAVEELQLVFAGPSGWNRLVMQVDAGGHASGRIPISDAAAGALRYYVEARAPSRYVLAHEGSEQTPLRAEAPPVGATGGDEESAERESGSNLTWLWVTLGVVAVGAAVGTALALTLPGEPPTGNLGAVELQ